MKKILLQFYSCYNLGDDLFVKIFAESFSDCRILLLVNPKCIPKNLGNNVRIHPYSFAALFLQKAMDIAEKHRFTRCTGFLSCIQTRCLGWLTSQYDAFVRIGGSIFMQHTPECSEIEFASDAEPDFTFQDRDSGSGNAFVIGANLGPVYTGDYWQKIREEFQQYRHICLRDYASYCQMRELPNVGYAPDVLFLQPMPNTEPRGENVVISVMDIQQYTADTDIIRSYYDLMDQSMDRFIQSGIPVTLVSFCQWQGDERAIETLLERSSNRERISVCRYRGEPTDILKVLAEASYIIGSRFHSIILGISFGKPVFPIVYSCKTAHYLSDLSFSGRFAELKDLPNTSVEDVLFNYQNRIITNCEAHRQYADNQFRGFRNYLSSPAIPSQKANR